MNTKEVKNCLVDSGLNAIGRKIKDKLTGLGTALTNNEMKDVRKVMRSLENRGILLKGTIRKMTSQERISQFF